MLDVVILCGGKGTRAYPDTLELPKPLLPVADVPIVEHVMHIYARQGHTRFILAVGYLGHMIAERYETPPEGLEVVVVDTGDETETGERIRRAAQHVRGDRFFATYADGLADVDLDALLTAHLDHGALGTVTTIPLPSQYGVLESDFEGQIRNFREKPRLADHWINGGFFVFERAALDHWEGEVLEQDVLPALSEAGGLYAYRHRGFWKSMDTYKDRQALEALASDGTPPWERQRVAAPVDALVGATNVSDPAVDTDTRSMREAGVDVATKPSMTIPRSNASRVATGVGAPSTPGRRPKIYRSANGNGGADRGREGGDTGTGTPLRPPMSTVRISRFTPPPQRVAARRLRIANVLTATLDLVAILAAYFLVGSIDTGPLGERLVGADDPFLLITVPVWLIAFVAYGLYDRRRLVAATEEARRLAQAALLGAVGVVLLTFVIDLPVARAWVAMVSMAAITLVAIARIIVRRVLHLLAARGVIGTRVLVVGTNDEAHSIARSLDRKRWLGYSPVGAVATGADVPARLNGFPVVGHIEHLADAIDELGVGAVIIASTSLPARVIADVCARANSLGVDIRVTPGLPLVSASRVKVEPLDGLPVLSVRRNHELSRSQAALKRTVDLIGGGLLLLACAPVMFVLAVLIRIESRGPAMFKQVRVGEGGRPFVLYKLRTMTADAEERVVDLREQNQADGLLFKVEDDPRVTRLGRSLRRWGLDELPQLWNVITGEMSLVGPRPPMPTEAERYDNWVRGRLKVKPGITGLWQVNGGHLLGFDDYVRYDLFYVENWSLGLDLIVLARTLPALVLRRGIA